MYPQYWFTPWESIEKKALREPQMKSNPLKWHGGKSYLAKWILSKMPKHKHYVEPYFGGGAVLFAKDPEGVSEVVNDVNGELINFWRVLQCDFKEFERAVSVTPFSESEFNWSLNPCESTTNVLMALRFFIRYRQSRQGLGKDFATLSRTRTRRGMNEQVSSWLSAIEGLPEAHARLQRVVILNRDAIDVIIQQDGEDTLFYLDPPYLHETRTTTGDYDFEMSEKDHKRLLFTLSGMKGKFLLSGYHSKLYEMHSRHNRWRCHIKEIDNKASGKKVKDIKTECLWANF